MAEEAPPPVTTESIDDVGETDRRLLVAFVVGMLLGLGALGWYYHSPDKTAPICATADAHCGDKSDAGAQ